MSDHEGLEGTAGAGTRPAQKRPPGARRPRRWSKRSLRIVSLVAGVAGFLLPWGVIRAVPKAAQPAPQVVVVPAGSQVLIQPGSTGTAGVKVLSAPSGQRTIAMPAPVTVTGGSHPVP